MMKQFIYNETSHDLVLTLIIKVVSRYEQNEWPSPTITDLSNNIGYSEETILESLEFGNVESVSILQ